VVGYIVYVALVALGFLLWILLFLAMRRTSGQKRDITGWFLIGPLHTYLGKRGYSLTSREVLGWGAVLLLMIAAPPITWLMER
jgi:uncharacterized membrane protein